MKNVTLKRIGVLKLALISAITYAILGLIFAPFILISMAIGAEPLSIFGVILAFVLVPILYGLLGFVMSALAIGLFNLVAPRVGGVELQIETDVLDTI